MNRTNRTVSVTATESVEVPAELAIVEIGCQSFGETREAVLEDNFRTSQRITEAVERVGVPKANIQTSNLRLSQIFENDKVLEQIARGRRFVANQGWQVQVSAERADSVIEAATRAGANVLGTVRWTVRDPAALEGRAAAVAMMRVRKVAEEMAAGLGGKLGELIYASNELETRYEVGGGVFAGEGPGVGPEQRSLRLFPQKVSRRASVHAVFALQ
ncbi:MAG TPA: SIMPL domain-containing protein [Terriglobales bacterium]|nr:SIMPL domain-containing protein [Terriglobales bacterium]